MDVIKIFVNKNNQAMVRCPACAMVKALPVERFKGKKHALKLRCACERVFQVELDFRGAYRKKTKLSGCYAILAQGGGGGRRLDMYVEDLSLTGIGFTSVGQHGVKVGTRLTVEFVLNDANRTAIKKQVVVRRVENFRIGCEFVGETVPDKVLGFYLMP